MTVAEYFVLAPCILVLRMVIREGFIAMFHDFKWQNWLPVGASFLENDLL